MRRQWPRARALALLAAVAAAALSVAPARALGASAAVSSSRESVAHELRTLLRTGDVTTRGDEHG